MTRSLVGLSGRRRVASVLGVGLLAGSLALAGCSSSSPKGGGTIPPVNAATAESLSDPDLGYTVVSIPDGLDAAQTRVLQDYVAYDKATWRVWSTREGLDEALGRTTGAAQVTLQNTYDSMTDQDNPPMKVGVGDIEVSKDAQTADVTVCLDKTQVTNTDFQGNDVTNKERQRRVKIQVHMVPDDSGVWVTENEKKLSFNECTTESGK